ncbi:uncharacterized protein TRIREDRAFT_21255 [Trichoderma reesei QM6a]|uniref:Predicted protein n=2 Tax=Hypocrea jecorina TaxID=51453 RepID=G0R8B1_HYPJQ|nr:uncharacterized protein TRIREDRAFT_21255 [Trichoderma reesei QM6a]EGR52850.1 predicted protein [Trichoderma reesei QM6a]ETS06609.1 hypothetical protein M419DRAFT_139776 [Trichoderma reesei RUT C-30]
MLAVRQPLSRMGSSQPDSDPFQMPFGYSVDGAQEPLFEPPEPAPGAPLLSETDNKFLSDFFDDVAANQYNMPSFGEGLNFNAWFDLPPQFMGTATSYGSQASTPAGPESHLPYSNDSHNSHAAIPGSHLMPPPPPPPPPHAQSTPYQQHPSDDVLNAAATLMQNGPGLRGAHKNLDLSTLRRPLGPPVGHLRHQPLEEFREESRKSMAHIEVDNTFAEWMWGSKGRQNSTPRAIPVDYQWGSDSNFNLHQGYTPGANKETVELQQQEQLKCLECLEPNKSAATTRPSSPTNSQSTFSLGLQRDVSEAAERPADHDDDAPPRKRRKSKIVKKDSTEEGDDEGVNAIKPAAGKRRKAKGERTGSVSSPPTEAGTTHKRRKSALSAAKTPRENLSEEQKRENHIRSEQKRRTLIKEGFDDLCEIVPGLRGGGFSKSTMLTMTAEWLEELLLGNRELTAQLAAIEGR